MMRRLIWRGVAVALMTGGMCWTVVQFQQCPRCPVAQLLRSVLGCTRSADSSAGCSSQPAPVIVDLSAPWLKDPGALFPEDNLQLGDVIPSRERSKQLDLIDLSLLSEAANPARPNYEEEEAMDPYREVLAAVNGQAEKTGAEAPRVTPAESQAKQALVTPAEDGKSPRYMSYAEEEAEDLQLHIELTPPGPDRLGYRRESLELFKQRLVQEHLEAVKRSEAVHLEEPPLAQEDSAASYDCPGCLRTDPRPATEQKPNQNMPKAKQSPSTPSRDHGADARPTGIKYHTTLKQSIPAAEDTRPTHPEVDTMEFRPTDAGAVDFLHRRQVY